MTTKSRTQGIHTSPLRRSIRKRIADEDLDEEFNEDRFPFRYLIGKSIDKYVADPKFPFEDPDDEDALEIATRALVYRYVHFVQLDLNEVMLACESPIERTMLGAFVAVAVKEQLALHLKTSKPIRFGIPDGLYPSRFSLATLSITPQAQLGDYRVDFLLEYEVNHTSYPAEAKHYSPNQDSFLVLKPEMGKEMLLTKDLIVECDGHDFHEKTKSQAARDKQRDRLLQSIGYNVFRFTGSEIHNDAISCAYEVFHSMTEAIRKQIPQQDINP